MVAASVSAAAVHALALFKKKHRLTILRLRMVEMTCMGLVVTYQISVTDSNVTRTEKRKEQPAM